MKKLKNKFILIVIFIIVGIVGSQVFIAYSNSNVDTNSYVTLVKGNALLNEQRLDIQQEYIIHSGDKIRVIGDSALAVIKWGDGSLTRLGGNTKISIQQNEISRDHTNINISFDLIAGKTWSNVVSFIGSDSSFTQTFDGIEAGVRGTIFDVDIDKQFIHVTDHSIELRDGSGGVFTVSKGDSLSLENFTLINISELISSLEDSAWHNINKQLDADYIEDLRSHLISSLEGNNPFMLILSWIYPQYEILESLNTQSDFDIIKQQILDIPPKKRVRVYDAVLSKYQSMNFVAYNDYENYKRKIFYKKALVLLSSSTVDTQRLLQSSAYDLQDIVRIKDTQGLSETLGFLQENKAQLGDIDISFLSGGLEYLPEGLLDEFKKSFGDISNILNIDLNTISDIDTNKVGDLLDSADQKIQDLLEENVGGLLQNVAQ